MTRRKSESAKRIAQLEKQLVNNGAGSDLFQRAMAEVLQEATYEELNIAAGSAKEPGPCNRCANDRHARTVSKQGRTKSKPIQRRKGEKIMINHEEEKVQAAYKENVEASTQEAPLTEEEAYVKDKILEHYDDEEEGTLVFTQAMAEAAADAILKAESYLYNTGIEKHEKAVNVLGEQAKALIQRIQRKKEAILNRNEFTDEAKAERLNDLYDEYETKMKAVMGEQLHGNDAAPKGPPRKGAASTRWHHEEGEHQRL